MTRHTVLPRQREPFDFPHGPSQGAITDPASQAGRRRFDSGRPLQCASGVTAHAEPPVRLPAFQTDTHLRAPMCRAGSSRSSEPAIRAVTEIVSTAWLPFGDRNAPASVCRDQRVDGEGFFHFPSGDAASRAMCPPSRSSRTKVLIQGIPGATPSGRGTGGVCQNGIVRETLLVRSQGRRRSMSEAMRGIPREPLGEARP